REEPVLTTVALQLGVLHDEPVDASLGLCDMTLELLVLVANRDDVRGGRTDVREPLRGVGASCGGGFELGARLRELLRETRDLRLELAHARPGLLEISLGDAEPLPRDRLRLQVPRQHPAFLAAVDDADPCVARVLVAAEHVDASPARQIPEDPVLEARPRPQLDANIVGHVTALAVSGQRDTRQANEARPGAKRSSGHRLAGTAGSLPCIAGN